MNTVTCEVCGAAAKRITHKHLAKHNMTTAQYQELYPNAAMISPQLRMAFRTNTLDHFISKYGDEGASRYEQYKQFQSTKNTFEYKAAKYGWSREQFDAYNASRAVTLSNTISRHGETEGRKKWANYVEHQRSAGISLEWFIEKHGVDKGTELHNQVQKAKSHSLESYIQRYGPVVGKQRHMEWITKKCSMLLQHTSAAERQFAAEVTTVIDCRAYSALTDQYKIWDPVTKRIYCYDLVFPDLRLAIEYHGDYWHCNPAQYDANFVHPTTGQLASTIWKQDELKQNALRARGFESIIVWDSDWKRDKAKILEQIQEYVKRKL